MGAITLPVENANILPYQNVVEAKIIFQNTVNVLIHPVFSFIHFWGGLFQK